ncbi:putative arginine metabolism regulation protein iii [Phaeomoniella chlamydospora]|uniref:Kinase n=1 Tax=Phaeomoniella chlamydospora TaxID=158046 RepID=A0A0G2G4D7_PHACM|nr:putative arginine metabolism regulation protein iii [Phaeomoniella chlamydospora]
MVSEGKLVDFDHVAAGHEGVQSTATGELIFKPCTQSEVDFYESAADHTAFHKHIPVHVGALTLRSHMPDLSAIQQASSSGTPSLAASSIPEETPIMSSSLTPEMSKNIMPLMAPPPSQGWVPSGGKRIDSGLLIALENVAYGFERPNILDVKLGARLWADDAPPAKRAKLDAVSKETTSSSLGFRIAGMKVWKNADAADKEAPTSLTTYDGNVFDKDGYRCYNKNYGRMFNDDDVKNGFETYFYGLAGIDRSRSKAIIERMLIDLRDIERVLTAEESRMYSSSILMVYEGDPKALNAALEIEHRRLSQPANPKAGIMIEEPAAVEALSNITDSVQPSSSHVNDENNIADDEEENEDEEDAGPKVYDVRMIDFAHASWTPGQGPDENVLKGIRNVIRILQGILDDDL